MSIREWLTWLSDTMSAWVAGIPDWSAWWLLVPAGIVLAFIGGVVWFITRPLDYY